MTSRVRAVEIARSLAGLSADPKNPKARREYLDLIAPGEEPQKAADMARMSGCGLVVAGLWRRLGLEHPLLCAPYKVGTAISRLVEIGIRREAWKPYRKGKLPLPGDAVLVGSSIKGEVEHFYLVVQVEEGDRTVIDSIDGGQRVDGHQAILSKKRVWASGRDLVIAGKDPGAELVGGRTIIGWVDLQSLVEAEVYGG
ncbi:MULTISPECIES: hypothetical protein [Sorangium]|uniref:Peptidase C51 domain-containing protein n=1 Tax=Sorangium cellulosum TaxID=56 RepID=A0A4P2QPY8_SORCE|nr:MULTISPECIES: hypothetical protein [Sorangium]AUX31911.1 uncharacterized protein SOCE836_040460 [Sorangium cellulosum]WCQ91285.1 hypothetical protein NQZ70_04001 [Sorangium sp. Soce836]